MSGAAPAQCPDVAPGSARRWRVTRQRGDAGAFHARPVLEVVDRCVAVLEVDRPALVLGSTQPAADVDLAALARAGVSLVRRRSGGGAVLLRPGETVWVDVDLPRGDPLWEEDVGRSFHWLGRVWSAALAALGEGPAVHEGALVATPWSRTVCFAGLGPGEVTIAGAKAVGISQRRTRNGARFQCAVLRAWDPDAVVSLLALDPRDRAGAGRAIAAGAVGVAHGADELVEALLAHLPR